MGTGFWSKMYDKVNSYVDSQMKKEFKTTDVDKAKEIMKQQKEAASVFPVKVTLTTPPMKPDTIVKSEVVDESGTSEEIFEAELVED